VLSLPPTTKLWYGGAVDLRLGFDGLYRHVQSTLKCDPLSGHLFIFTNAAANRLKVLYWSRHGLCLWCQRLESGRYHFPTPTESTLELTATEFAMILDGIDYPSARRFTRYSRPKA
jgi:transposase